jgi:glycosyltransferase involved in cell wall biosynthesis
MIKNAPPCFSLIGFLLSEIGLGQAARNIAYSLEFENLPVNLVNIHLEGRSNSQEFISKCGPFQAGNVNFVVCGLDNVESFYSFTQKLGSGIKNYLYPSWELDRFPYSKLKGLNSFDEIIAPSSFIANALSNFIGKDIKTIPQPVRIPNTVDSNYIRDGVLRIYSSMDFDSTVARKNPKGILEAFSAAFPKRYDDVQLILKVRGRNDLGERSILQAHCSRDSRIKVIDQTLSRIELDLLADASNVYLSMHRSEGFGFGPAEALASEKIVVSTDYGGTCDFINSSTGYPVDYKLIPLKPGDYPYWENQLWAEPMIDSAVHALREIYDHYDRALERAKKGRNLMLDQHAFGVAGRALKHLL